MTADAQLQLADVELVDVNVADVQLRPEAATGVGEVQVRSRAAIAEHHLAAEADRIAARAWTAGTRRQYASISQQAAHGVVVREIPQYRKVRADQVAVVLSLSTSKGSCTQRRPVRCSLAAGAAVTIRTRTRVLVAAPLTSVVVVSSQTPESNTTSNMATAKLTTFAPTPIVLARISAPAAGQVGRRRHFRVAGSLTPGSPASRVRVCIRPPVGLVPVRVPHTFRFRGRYCRDYDRLRPGRRATASMRIRVTGPIIACSARVAGLTAAGRRPPTAHAAC